MYKPMKVGVFMIQLVYKDKFYLAGNINEVLLHLKSLSQKYKTLQDLISHYNIQNENF